MVDDGDANDGIRDQHESGSLKSNETRGFTTQTCASGNLRIIQEIRCPRGSTTVAYTDDLQLLAVGQENGSVQLLEKGNPTMLLYDSEMALELEPCTDIKTRASPKNGFHKSILATYLSGHIKLWDTKIGKCLFTMKEKRQIYGLNYHPMTSKFVTFGDDFKLYLYDEERRVTERILACSEVVGSKNGHTDSVCCAKFHPRNPFEIISSGFDGTVQFWDLRAPYAVRNIQDVVSFGEALDISLDGKMIAAGMSNTENGTVRIFDYDSGSQIEEHNFLKTRIYCCRFLTPSHIGIGGFLANTFLVGNLKTGEVFGYVSDLPGCVMSFALKQKTLQQRLHARRMPDVVVSSADKLLELEMMNPVDEEDRKSAIDRETV